jgi:Na+/melibiose symporter-like transporter
VKTLSAPQYANLGILITVMVLPVALIFGLASAFGGFSVAAPVGGSIGMLICAINVHRRCIVEVNDKGIELTTFGRASLSIPWSDVDSVEGHAMGLRIVRRSTAKRPFVQIFSSDPLNGPVALAIRTHQDTPESS